MNVIRATRHSCRRKQVVLMLGKALLRNTEEIVSLINRLMALVVGGFTNEYADVQLAAFDAWFVLIVDCIINTLTM